MKAVVVFFAFLFFLHFADPSFAVAPNITAYPNTAVSLDTSFTVTATMSGLTNNVIYRLRVAIAQSGTSNYFGSTYDGTTWHMGSITDGNFISITTDGNGAWGGDIQGKIDSDDPNFTTGSGTYDLKIFRYTQTGSSPTPSNLVSITITVPPTPTPTLTPTPTPTTAPTSAPTPTNTPTPTPASASSPTNTPTPTKTPTPIPTTNTPTSKPTTLSAQENASQNSVLGESSGNGLDIPPPDNLISDQTKKPDTVFQGIIMLLGIVFITACVILTVRIIKKGELTQNEEE
jgi:hypothetical protein